MISFVTFALTELAVLPLSLHWETIGKSTGLSESEVSINQLIAYLFHYTNMLDLLTLKYSNLMLSNLTSDNLVLAKDQLF